MPAFLRGPAHVISKSMTIFTRPLRPDISAWIEQRVATGEHATPEDYVSMLVERDRDERSEEEKVADLRRLLADAEASGISDRSLDQIFDEAVERVRAQGLLRD